MERVEERRGYAISLEKPPSRKSLWAAVVRSKSALIAASDVKICLGCSRERVLADARAFIDEAVGPPDGKIEV
jgi:hypothetical protein